VKIVDRSETAEVVVTFVETATEFFVHWMAKPVPGSTDACTPGGAMVFRSLPATDQAFALIDEFVKATCQEAAAFDYQASRSGAAS